MFHDSSRPQHKVQAPVRPGNADCLSGHSRDHLLVEFNQAWKSDGIKCPGPVLIIQAGFHYPESVRERLVVTGFGLFDLSVTIGLLVDLALIWYDTSSHPPSPIP